MIIAQITGGLGNQMFQYASAKALSLHHQTNLKLDLSSFKRDILPELEVPRKFELTCFENFHYQEATPEEINQFEAKGFISKKLQKILPRHRRNIYSEKEFPFDPNFFQSKRNLYLRGHRQTEKYFKKYKHKISQEFTINPLLVTEVDSLADQLKKENSVAVHVRRGDYLRLPIILDWHGVLTKEYYFNALQSMLNKFKDLRVYYFSDDIDWVENELLPNFPGTIISDNVSKNHHQDFYLIKSCRNQIVANSSFSWWAAWLNPNPDKIVIAPKKWFNNAPYDTRDLIPESWITL